VDDKFGASTDAPHSKPVSDQDFRNAASCLEAAGWGIMGLSRLALQQNRPVIESQLSAGNA